MLQDTLTVETRGKGFVDITARVAKLVEKATVTEGICSVFVLHTSASLVIQENADPAVLRDLQRFIDRVAPEGSGYEHDAEGPDDMPAHIRSAITKTSETIPVTGGRLAMGTWQALYLWEHRSSPHRRSVVVTVVGRSL